MRNTALAMAGAAALTVAGCGDGSGMMTGPLGPGGVSTGTPAFMSISPAGGAMGVPVAAPLELHWGVAMGAGMEQFVDLHMDDLSGPVVPMSCAWSGDQTTLLCTPSWPLQPGTQYLVHVGGGMADANGQLIDMNMYGPGLGGQWVQGGMMGASHAGMGWGMMGGGWRHPDGPYGMVFTFTTA
jgi:hypothetical protein